MYSSKKRYKLTRITRRHARSIPSRRLLTLWRIAKGKRRITRRRGTVVRGTSVRVAPIEEEVTIGIECRDGDKGTLEGKDMMLGILGVNMGVGWVKAEGREED